ncbi:MAG: iron chelate uptake ABC transporter family permease subunit [Pseudomonadota bacterium]
MVSHGAKAPFSVWRLGPISLRFEQRALVAAVGLTFGLLLVSLLSLSAGSYPMNALEALKSALGVGDQAHDFIVHQIRLPRLLTGVLAGAAFGVSGAIFQSLARNALASPDVLGFNAGCSLGAVAAIVFISTDVLTVTLGAVLGGVIAAALVFGLAWQNGIAPFRLILIGIGIGAMLYASVDFLLTRTDIYRAGQAIEWLIGSLNARNWGHVERTSIGLVLLLPIALSLQYGLNRLALGDDLATGLGLSINRLRLLACLVGVLLVALAVSVVGPIAFVAFVAGPIARRIAATSSAALGTSALVGAIVLTAADIAGRVALPETDLPAGVFTAILGAPYLLWLLSTQFRKGIL